MSWPGTMLLWSLKKVSEKDAFAGTRVKNCGSRGKAQALNLDDAGQSLRKSVSVVGVSERAMRWIAEEDLRYKSKSK